MEPFASRFFEPIRLVTEFPVVNYDPSSQMSVDENGSPLFPYSATGEDNRDPGGGAGGCYGTNSTWCSSYSGTLFTTIDTCVTSDSGMCADSDTDCNSDDDSDLYCP